MNIINFLFDNGKEIKLKTTNY